MQEFAPLIIGTGLSIIGALSGAVYLRITKTLDHVAKALVEVSVRIAKHEQQHIYTEKRLTKIEEI